MVYFSQSAIEGYEKQIHQFQLKLSQNDEERSLLRERLNEVELELKQKDKFHPVELFCNEVATDLQCYWGGFAV